MNFFIYLHRFASLAQLVEQLIRNEQVVGSSPIGGSQDCGLLIADFKFKILIFLLNLQSEIGLQI